MRKFEVRNPEGVHKPRGFSHSAVVTGGRLLFIAGQTAANAEGEIVGRGDITRQFEQVLKNLKTVVEAHGGELKDLVKLNFMVTNKDLYKAHLKPIGEIYRRYFGNFYPPITFWETPLFQDGTMVEIDGVAVLDA